MDTLAFHACRLPLLRTVSYCAPITDSQSRPERSLYARLQTAPDGQVLPEWLTWSSVSLMLGNEY
jgi:hypothetical protein